MPDPVPPELPDGAAQGLAAPGRAAPGDQAMSRSVTAVTMAVIAVLLVALAGYGVLTRQRSDTAAVATPTTPGELLRAGQARGTTLPSVGRVRGLPLPCTTWLLAPEDPAGPAAYAITAGRCTGIVDASTVLRDEPVQGVSVEFNTFAPVPGGSAVTPVTAEVAAIAWASVRGVDLAVLRLSASPADLAARGIDGVPVTEPLAPGGQVLVAGVPVAGVPGDEVHLRGSRCEVGVTTDLADGPWLLRDTRAVGCRGMLEGSAGSPALNTEGQAIAMVSTTTLAAAAGADCALGRPCQVGGGTVAFAPDTTYLTPVDALLGCFPEGRFTLGEGCDLERPEGVVVASTGASSVPAGATVEVRIAVGSPRPAGVLAQMLADASCWDSAGWRTASTDLDGVLTVTAPTTQGLALLCVGTPEQPTPLRVTVAGTAPDAGAIVLRQVPVRGGIEVQPVVDPPRYATFSWLSGPAGTTDCASAEGYVPYTGTPAFLEAADLPSTVCVIAYDEAGTPSVPVAFEVG